MIYLSNSDGVEVFLGTGIGRSDGDYTTAIRPGENHLFIEIVGKDCLVVGSVVFDGFYLITFDINDVVGVG